MEEIIQIDYTPRAAFETYHESNARFSITIAHRRAGKTVARINKLIQKAAMCEQENPRFAYLAPFFVQAKDIAWQYLKHYAQPIIALGGKVNESELSVNFPHNNATIRLYGAENAERLRGLYFDGVVVDEAQDIAPYVLTQIIYPALADRLGWLDMSGTPKGYGNLLGETFKLARNNPTWFMQVLKASETNIINNEELGRLKAAMSDQEYEAEFECSFDAAIRGSYYGDLLKTAEAEGRVCMVPHETALRVHCSFDLGMSDDTAIVFYQVSPAGQVRVLDFYEGHGVGLDHYVRVINDKAKEKGWTMGDFILPHDVRVRELGTGKSRFEILQSLGIHPQIAPNLAIQDGINAVRMMLPKTWFDANANVLRLIDLLKAYRREYDEKRQIFYEKPLHSIESHAADSTRYMAVAMREQNSAWTGSLKRGLRGVV